MWKRSSKIKMPHCPEVNDNINMMSSAKVIEKLKQGIHGLEKSGECKSEETCEAPLDYLMDNLTPELMEEARTKLKESEETKTKALEELKQLIRKDTNLVTPTDDLFLLAFLRSRKYNVKKAFKLLQNYWRFRLEHRDIYDTADTTAVKQLILKNYLGFLPYRDKKGCVVLVLKVGDWDPEVDGLDQMIRTVSAILIHAIQYPATQIAGFRMIFDVRTFSWPHLKMLTPQNILLMIHSTQYCFPARYKGFHILSENKVFNLAWAMMHPFLTSKLKKRVMLHGQDLKPLLDYIHPSVLPVEFGGMGPPFENSSWAQIMDDGTDQVMNLLNYGYKK